MEIFKNCATAIVTPFSENTKINYAEFEKLIDFQILSGVSALVFMGTTGEASTLTQKEKFEVAKFAVNYVNGRVPVIMGSGSNNTVEAVEKSIAYEKIGVDALLHVTPYYNKCTQTGLIEHFTAVANSVKLPIILYNIPGRTGVNMEAETVQKLSEIPNIVGIKEASGNLDQIINIIRLCGKDFSVYSGDDNLILPIMAVGGKGVISVISNIMPMQTEKMCEAVFNNNLEEAKSLTQQLYPVIKMLFLEVNPIPIKSALNMLGFNVGKPRLPLTELLESNKLKLKNVLNPIN